MKKQNKTNRWLAALLMLGAVMFTGCVDKDNPIVEPQNVVAFADNALTDGVLLVDPYADNMTFDITTNGEWRIEQDARFFSVEPESGSGPATVTLFLQTNNREERKTGHLTVVFPANEAQNQTVTIEQKWKGEMPTNADPISKTNKIYAVGYSYDATGYYASPNSVKAEVFDTSKLISKGKLGLNSPEVTKEDNVVTGSSITELTNKLAVKAEANGGFGKFKAEAQASFNMDYAKSNNYEYAIAYLDLAVYTASFDLTLGQLVGKYMTDEAYEDINGETRMYASSRKDGLKNLIRDYGTHVVMSATLGGRVRYSMQVDISNITTAYDVEAYAKASYSGMFGSGSASVDDKFKTSYEQNKSKIATKLDVLGGDEILSKKLGSLDGFNKANLDAWVESCREDNMALVGFLPGSLVPLYELVDQEIYPERYNELKNYMENGIAADYSSYDCGTVTEFEVPSFNSSGTLIKDVNVGGQWVGQVCEEYIPNINRASRVTVVYPVVNNTPRYNMGFFLGNDTHKPARVSWDGTNAAVYEYADLDFGAVNKLYLRGASISPELADGTEPRKGTVKDEYLSAFTRDYILVKIFDNIWMREDYQATRKGSGYNLTDKEYTTNGGNIFYNLSLAFDSQFPPSGWQIASSADYSAIQNKLTANGINSVGEAFSKSGRLGFQCLYNGWIGSEGYKNGAVEYLTSDAYYVYIDNSSSFSLLGPYKKGEQGYHFEPVRLVKK